MITVDPMFKRGPVPAFPHCEIQDIKPDGKGGYLYFIANHYNAYASGWGSEDWIVSEIVKLNPPTP